MSKEHAHGFHEKVNNDKALRARIRAATDKASDSLIEIAKQEGFEFTRDELRETLHKKWGSHAMLTKTNDEDEPDTCFIPSERPGF